MLFENIKTLEEFKLYIRRKLGEPKVRVEIADSQIEANIHDTVQLYREYASGNGNWRNYMVLDVTATVQDYVLPDNVMQVIDSKRSKNTSAWVLAQLSGAAASDVLNLKQFDMVSFVMLNQWLRYLRIITPSQYRYQFNNNTKTLKIMPTPTRNDRLFLEVMTMATLAELWDERWVKDYALALCYISLGEVRGKLQSLPGFGGSVSLNGDALTSKGEDMKKDLEHDLIQSFKWSKPPLPFFHSK